MLLEATAGRTQELVCIHPSSMDVTLPTCHTCDMCAKDGWLLVLLCHA